MVVNSECLWPPFPPHTDRTGPPFPPHRGSSAVSTTRERRPCRKFAQPACRSESSVDLSQTKQRCFARSSLACFPGRAVGGYALRSCLAPLLRHQLPAPCWLTSPSRSRGLRPLRSFLAPPPSAHAHFGFGSPFSAGIHARRVFLRPAAFGGPPSAASASHRTLSPASVAGRRKPPFVAAVQPGPLLRLLHIRFGLQGITHGKCRCNA